MDKASYLEAAVERASGSADKYEANRKKVLVCCPDGATDEQLGGKLVTRVFPNLAFVIRCAAHASHGSIKGAWQQDDEVTRVKNIVQEVGEGPTPLRPLPGALRKQSPGPNSTNTVSYTHLTLPTICSV